MTDEQRKAYNRAYYPGWYSANREKRLAYYRDYREANPTTQAERKLMAEANKEQRKIYNKRARAKLKAKKASA